MEISKMLKLHSADQTNSRLLYDIRFMDQCLAYWLDGDFKDGLYKNKEISDVCLAAPLIMQAREWCKEHYDLTFQWYRLTNSPMFGYFVFEKGKVLGKGSIAKFTELEAEQLALTHCLMTIKEVIGVK